MPSFHLGILCGLVFGALSALSMLPLKFPDKRAALLGAFFNRFAIGFCIGLIPQGRQGWLTGLVVAVIISLSDAIVTKAYGPILAIGAAGGAVIGWILARFGR